MEENECSDPAMAKLLLVLDVWKNTRKRFRYNKQYSSVDSKVSTGSQHQNNEAEFLHKVEIGDYPGMVRLLENSFEINVDCEDRLNRSAITLAIRNEHLEIVEYLLDKIKEENIYEAALLAINLGYSNIAESILKHPRYQQIWTRLKLNDSNDGYGQNKDPKILFSQRTTPLINAAQNNMWEIVQLLLNRGERINVPHHYNCRCENCVAQMQYDRLRSAKSRLNSYRGLASEAYISLSSKDPILTAFQLSDEIQELLDSQKFFRTEYYALVTKLDNFVVKLLNHIYSQTELELIINKVGKSHEEKYENLGRLKLAIRYQKKQFVVHPAIQQRLVHTWYAGKPLLEHSGLFQKLCGMFLVLIFYPLLLVAHLVKPKSQLGKILVYPCIKFMCHILSFIVFLSLIVISSLNQEKYLHQRFSEVLPDIYEKYISFRNASRMEFFGQDFPLRKSYANEVELMLFIFVIGFILQEMNQLYEDGIKDYFSSSYNIIDFIMLAFYFLYFTLQACILYKKDKSMSYLRQNLNSSGHFNECLYHIYWLNADRYYWDMYDPDNISDATHAVANILTFARISYVLPASSTLGPLQISLGRMIKEIAKFLILFSLILLAYILGLQNLFWYYGVHEKIEVVPRNLDVKARENFGNFIKTFRTLFWSLYGRGDAHVVLLGKFQNTFTEDVGYFIFGLYNITMVTVLINMLIAMMTRIFDNITEYADCEWKYARTLLFMEYIGEGSTLPVPFNMLGIPRFLFSLVQYLVTYCRTGSFDPEPQKTVSAKDTNVNSCYVISESSFINTSQELQDNSPKTEEMSYEGVMVQVIQRYILDVQRQNEVTEDEIQEIKNDISSFHYDMKNRHDILEQSQQKLLNLMQKLNEMITPLPHKREMEENTKTPTKNES